MPRLAFPAVFSLTLWSTPAKVTTNGRQGVGDLGLFRAVVNGMHAGRPYYDVYGSESRRLGYPTRVRAYETTEFAVR